MKDVSEVKKGVRGTTYLLTVLGAGNRLGDEGAARLGEALQRNTSLTSLKLTGLKEGRGTKNRGAPEQASPTVFLVFGALLYR